MKIKNLLIACSTLLINSNNIFSQDIVFKNLENRVMHDFLDTSISVNNKKIKVFIGPEFRQSQNTIFFNGTFKLTNTQIEQFRIKGSFLNKLIIDSTEFIQEQLRIDSTDFDTFVIVNSSFKKSVVFNNVTIKNLDLSHNDFPDSLLFINCNIENLTIETSKVKGLIIFNNCSLQNINFEGTVFYKTCYFSNNSLSGNIIFNACVFNRNLNLSSLKTRPETRFSFFSTILPDTLDFSKNIALNDTIDLTKVFPYDVISPKRKCNILLNETDISDFKINYSPFRLIFPSHLPTDEKESIYQNLLDNFKKNAYQQSFELLDVEYRRFKSKQGTFGFLWWIPELWWNYGYDRGNIFKIVFWSILILTILNFFLLNYMVTKVYRVGNIPEYYLKWNFSRLWFAFVYTSVIFFSLSIKIDKVQFKEKWGTIYLMAMYIFGIICLAYMANYIIQR